MLISQIVAQRQWQVGVVNNLFRGTILPSALNGMFVHSWNHMEAVVMHLKLMYVRMSFTE